MNATNHADNRRQRRTWSLATLPLLASCVALELAGRGAPANQLRTFTLELDPVDLPVMSGHDHGLVPEPLHASSPIDGWVHGFEFELVDERGEQVPDQVLHHGKVLAPDRRDLFSPMMMRLFGAGQETGAVTFPTRIGYRVRKNDPLLITAMLHNPTGRSLENVRVRVHIAYTVSGPWKDPLSIAPFFTHVTDPSADSFYDLPPGRSERAFDVRPAVRGKILALGGHLHRYGAGLRFEDVTKGEVLWETEPVLDGAGDVVNIPDERFVWSRGITIEPSHLYRLTAIYHNPTDSTIAAGGMGTMGGIIVPQQPWPSVDEGDPVFRLDWRRETGEHAHH